ncbi:hypothetical protein G7B40_032800 [Aetokthonos hydrillicola Thurmond2011]|jgi:hypothetical protein|uniref:Uncharacterized protein n=1 Tax=Aetokthonos hydrillicola Thurmond2011 TaxID=2712845 RepID=A0AAP5ID08_9CYAN|nr:hypothetical protein [Aetokthonos hydrillicola]MBW4585803.1 hypothetical protein [Aetokthonos hydrillicola CCALA 1050]MDR9899306.1 hypothetical protein [Aetokthonos hydrillicola Thurmond2011]
MSEDHQNLQPPSSPKPEVNQPETNAGQVTQRPQKQYQRVEPLWKTKATQFLQQLWPWWNTALAKIRSFLPESLSAKLSNTVLTAILAGISVVIIWITSGIFSHKSPQTVNIPQEIFVTETTPLQLVPTEAQPTQEITPPEQLSIQAQPIEEITPPEPQPTPAILTPEQSLIVAIENQVVEESDRVGSGLIESIQANFRNSSLVIRISDNWYKLERSQQQELAEKIQERSKELDFTHIDIIDSQGKLVARNPVVGTEMILFH